MCTDSGLSGLHRKASIHRPRFRDAPQSRCGCGLSCRALSDYAQFIQRHQGEIAMPFEPAPSQTITQRQLGRVALEAIAAHILTVPAAKFDLEVWQEERTKLPFLYPLVAP